MIHTTSEHHEQALSLFQQLLLTGGCIIPIAANAAHAVWSKKRGIKKGKVKR